MKSLVLFLAFCLLANLAFSQNKLPNDITESIKKRIEYGHTPSIVVGIIDKDGPQYYTFGTKTIGGQSVNEHTIYEIGSISKTFTAILLAQMADIDGISESQSYERGVEYFEIIKSKNQILK